MGFYIEDLPTEFNGITMKEADYLADEFLKDEPCDRMWDAMRALRDFYETVTNEAVELSEQTEPQSGYCNECEWYGDKQVCGRCRSRNLYAPKTEPHTEREGE